MTRQTSDTYATMGDWGANNAGQEPGMVALLHPAGITGEFDDWDTNGAAPGAWTGNGAELTEWGVGAYNVPDAYNPNFNNNNEIRKRLFGAVSSSNWKATWAAWRPARYWASGGRTPMSHRPLQLPYPVR